MKSLFTSLLCGCITLLVSNCGSHKKTEVIWNKSLPQIGSLSSPRTADLNNDGILDIVMGAGRAEYQYSEQGVLAFDGKSGNVLWQQETQDQVFGSATFNDINDDGVSDVLIGGRSPYFKALNGKNGVVIWSYDHEKYKNDSILQYANTNFYNSSIIPDQNNDNVADLLIATGGNPKSAPFSESDRYPGVLMVFDSKNGTILAADTMPDGKETYMAPVAFNKPDTEETYVVFGSGGETISGNLYLTTLSDLKNKNLSSSKIIAKETGHGFIAPPVLVDISQDGIPDIIAISHASTVFAIDGRSHQLLWKKKIPNTESSNSFAVGHFNKDDVPDFFTFVSEGEWPNSTGSVQIMLSGKDGEIQYTDSIGCTGFSSPVVYDLNRDGIDEAIISINEFDCEGGFVDQKNSDIENKLIAIDFVRNNVIPIDQQTMYKNIFSTPWIGDLDNDGYLDIVHCTYFNPSTDLMKFLGMNIKRISTHIEIDRPVKWGAYMGSHGNGAFENYVFQKEN